MHNPPEAGRSLCTPGQKSNVCLQPAATLGRGLIPSLPTDMPIPNWPRDCNTSKLTTDELNSFVVISNDKRRTCKDVGELFGPPPPPPPPHTHRHTPNPCTPHGGLCVFLRPHPPSWDRLDKDDFFPATYTHNYVCNYIIKLNRWGSAACWDHHLRTAGE